MNNLPEMCMSLLHGTGEPIIIKRGKSGYYPYHGDPDDFNKSAGVTPAQVAAMEVGSMFGWHVPGADPDSEFNAKLTDFPYKKRVSI